MESLGKNFENHIKIDIQPFLYLDSSIHLKLIMKTISLFIIPFLLSLAFLSCSEDGDQEIEIESDAFDFENLKVGDIMLYSFVTGVDYPSQSTEASYPGDTLELRVVDKVDGKFIVQERITENSAIFDSDIKYIYGEIEAKYELLWEIREDSLIITPVESGGEFNSHFFPRAFQLTLSTINENKAEFEGCHTTISYTVSYANFFIENGELLGINYPHLNGWINYSPMAFDGDGYTCIYNKESGFVRVTSTSGWTAEVRGWDRIN